MRSPGVYDKAPGEDHIEINGVVYEKGNKVRLNPSGEGTDAADSLLVNKIATIETIYVDYDDNVHFAVTIDEDPAQDLKQDLGLYLYYRPNEVELIDK